MGGYKADYYGKNKINVCKGFEEFHQKLQLY